MGVGTNAPAAQLHVNGAANADALLVQSNGVNLVRFAPNGTTIGPGTVRASLTIRGSDVQSIGPEIHLAGSGTNQFNAGRIRFLDGTASDNYRGAYIHYNGGPDPLHLGVHDTTKARASTPSLTVIAKTPPRSRAATRPKSCKWTSIPR